MFPSLKNFKVYSVRMIFEMALGGIDSCRLFVLCERLHTSILPESHNHRILELYRAHTCTLSTLHLCCINVDGALTHVCINSS